MLPPRLKGTSTVPVRSGTRVWAEIPPAASGSARANRSVVRRPMARFTTSPHPSPNARSVLAAITKSFTCRFRILCVHHVTVTRPHSVSSAG